MMNPSDLIPYNKNARIHDVDKIANSIREFGFKDVILIDEHNVIINGHGRHKASLKLGLKQVPVAIAKDLSDEEIKALRLADNKTAECTEWDNVLLAEELANLGDIDMSQFGFEECQLNNKISPYDKSMVIGLENKFLVPPFSYLDTRQKYFSDRVNMWNGAGIKSDIGRGDKLIGFSGGIVGDKNLKNTSIFNPALSELMYLWFSKKGDKVLDTFAGGSVRGIVADKLERHYTGIELRKEQVEANIENAKELKCKNVKWICGDSNIETDKLDCEYDFVLSCPPYADLEVYSDNPADISNMEYSKFLDIYRSIIKKTCDKLKDDRFIAWVIGEVRNKKGNYYNFLGDTIKAFLDAGVNYYNEIVLLNSVGTGAMRASIQFKNRKVVKLHQNVLIFCKGDWKKASARLGDVEIMQFEDESEQ